ncbi:hypothetical protein [Shewanella sp. GutDb-MelDb]|uniref:hypothetical protein n=1 Tax=Shewanella sp. GutDb-MelDb TaxID=2058316 RepID=UPI000C7DBCA7|nr:hypothetical protein [Shewanella sp. GutDb-MelDb]PKG57748.1 hypothetical protein CXF82_08220 [Shewanella sp. GutDb-MelDb]
MGAVTEKEEDVKRIFEYSKMALDWASVNAYRRIGLLLLIASISFGGWYGYINNLSQKVTSEMQAGTSMSWNLSNSNLYKYAIDSVQLCLTAIDKSSDLEDWYCSQALLIFKNRLSKAEIKHESELIDRKAYGAMKVYLADKERQIKYNELVNMKPSNDRILLESLLSSVAIGGTLLFLLAIYFLSAYFLYKRSARASNVS